MTPQPPSQPPPFEPRDRGELAAWTTELAQRYSTWRPAADGSPDLGSALIAIAAHFAGHVGERLNRAGDLAYLAFLDLVGEHPAPARPARVPLTFTAAPGVPAGVTVPAGTPVAAPPDAGDPGSGDPSAGDPAETVTYETDEPLVISPARLRHLVVTDPAHDTWTRVEVPADGGLTDGLNAFTGTEPVGHELFVAHPLLASDAPRALTVSTTSPGLEPWSATPATWSRWDGSAWTDLVAESGTATMSLGGPMTINMRYAPALGSQPREVAGVTGHWLRGELTVPLVTGAAALPPTAVAVGRRPPEAPAPGLAPFGVEGQVRWFYLSVPPPPAGAAGTSIRISVTAARWGQASAARPVVLDWTYRVGDSWKPLGRARSDGAAEPSGSVPPGSVPPRRFIDATRAFTGPAGDEGDGGDDGDGDWVAVGLPDDLAPSVLNGVEGRWLRVELVQTEGAYDVPPIVDAIEVAYERPTARLLDLTLTRDAAETAPVPVPAAFADGVELDLSRSVRPFGAQPAYDDTLYLECPEALAAAATLTLVVTVTNATGKAAAAPPLPTVTLTPPIGWETYDGARWLPVRSVSRADAFTVGGDVTLAPAAPSQPTEVGGRAAHWVRARLLGDYGAPAGYRSVQDSKGAWTVEYSPATLAPPVLADLGWRPLTVTSGLPEVLVTRNAGLETVHRLAPGQWLTTIRSEGGDGLVPFVGSDESDPALHLGFEGDFGQEPVTLFFPVSPPRPQDVAGDGGAAGPEGGTGVSALSLVWEYSGPRGWQPLAVVDATGGLADPGTVRFVGPPDQAPRTVAGRDGYWVRVRAAGGEPPFAPMLRGVLPDTVWATEGSTVGEEILGNGTGTPGLTVSTAHTPVLPGERLVVREATDPTTGEDVWVSWTAVGDLRASGPADRHFALDRFTGVIRFGDGLAGRMPPPGEGNIRIGYRYGGTEAGNRPAGTITQLAVAVPGLDAVVNHLPAEGGADRESLADIRDRGARTLRHRDRAVAPSDLEDLALAATGEVTRALAVAPSGYDPFDLWFGADEPTPADAWAAAGPGQAGVVIVPRAGGDRPAPSPGLIGEVRAYLLERAPATARVWVVGPEWIEVTVVATVVPEPDAEPGALRQAIRDRLRAFLHPLTGGDGAVGNSGGSGPGWDFGHEPRRSDLFALLHRVPGVSHVRQLDVRSTPAVDSEAFADRITAVLDRPLDAGVDAATDAEARRWLERALVFSGDHQITLTETG
ncbi:putative baseplate assembly protein [Pseudofrankia inefficax]|uniref:Baseplate J family protein n=1 Tax=Pseudofrankia inefficax (strain DSM 45817 / CECT 9037 / DDB 130130 / EuI1c) TaxID=298654 RepID=E3IXC3_PSEI1|nr:putative baseplate assembly protein [Pseudofrankia inefficax]ADP85023.1 Baseplate J family protein [Pseudofrankia inefficax]